MPCSLVRHLERETIAEEAVLIWLPDLSQTALNALGKVPGLSDSSALSQLQQANEQLTQAIKDQPDDATMGQVGPKLQDFKSKVAQAQSKLNSMKSTFKC